MLRSLVGSEMCIRDREVTGEVAIVVVVVVLMAIGEPNWGQCGSTRGACIRDLDYILGAGLASESRVAPYAALGIDVGLESQGFSEAIFGTCLQSYVVSLIILQLCFGAIRSLVST
eukprot:TRINITY_DN25162_c0_g2_i1.p1 TRINITY_DN25162_c0_g2~~TRINITY_DN25162_c0_g2_i1.p1  ORF type:complete len:116 (-),score=15.94 TRINITY_DN25162_c0_g2_i1:27-374(-)